MGFSEGQWGSMGLDGDQWGLVGLNGGQWDSVGAGRVQCGSVYNVYAPILWVICLKIARYFPHLH